AAPELPSIATTDATAYMDMDGPLRSLARSNGTLAEVPTSVQAGLEKTLNAAADDAQNGSDAPASVLGPPIYGSWQANQHTVPTTDGWLRDLNLDPRARTAAGLGSEIERRHQEDFMQWAWEQVGDVLKANALLSRSRLSMETLMRIHTRHIVALPVDRALHFSAPLQRRVVQAADGASGQAPVTVRAAIEQSSLPNAVTDPALRRLISPMSRTLQAAARHAPGGAISTGAAPRPVGAVSGLSATASTSAPTSSPSGAPVTTPPASAATTARASTAALDASRAAGATGNTVFTSTTSAPAPTGLVAKLAAGQLTVDPTRFVPDGVSGVANLTMAASTPGAQISLASLGLPITVAQATFVNAQSAAKGIATFVPPAAPISSVIAAAMSSLTATTGATTVSTGATSVSTKAVDSGAVKTSAQLKTTIGHDALASTTVAPAAKPIGPAQPIATQPVTKQPIVTQPVGTLPITAAPIETQPVSSVPPAPPAPQFVPFSLAVARDAVVSRTNPRATVFARVQTMLNIGGAPLALAAQNTGIVSPVITTSPVSVALTNDRIMAAPDLDVPVYRYLAELDPSRFLPGVGDVPNDSAMLLETNPRFIESLLVGLNYEMNRELLWREYPTDQRGTPFRRFWGWSDGGADITAINTWSATNALGANSRSGTGGQIVLLVRGRLLKRYPNTGILAWRSSGGRLVNPPGPTDVLTPVFTGVLGTDIAFAGFSLTDEDLLNGDGWFFVLQQQPTEPRFGFDEGTGAPQATLKSWSDANWDDVATAPGQYLKIGANRLSGVKLGSASFVDHAAHLAYITIQKPVAVALHSRTLVPNSTSPTT
ncbi:MAG TPA: hypothetical protein VGM50_10615, partial [Gemmatimonadaceae bacterium]